MAGAGGGLTGSLKRGFIGLAALVLLVPASAPARDDTPHALRAQAFEAAQWAMSSEAADALALVSARFAQGDDALAGLAERREALVVERDRLERRLEGLYVSEDAAALTARAGARQAWEAANRDLAAADADIRARFPAYADLTNPRALAVDRVQALLKGDEALLLVLVNPEATYVWGVTRERVVWARSDLGEAEIDAAVQTLRSSLTATAARGDNLTLYAGPQPPVFQRAIAYNLYTELVRPVETAFEGKTTLVTVATGSLATLPFSVLTTAAPQGRDASRRALAATPWLIDRYALAALPSVSSLESLRCHLASAGTRSPGCLASGPAARPARRTGSPLAAYGAPVLTGAPDSSGRGADGADMIGGGRLADVAKLRALPYLKGSQQELEALKARYPTALVRMGAEATEGAVKADDRGALSDARYVLFSTHGLMAGAAAAEPGLVLTPPDQASELDDGYLSASEAAQLRLNAEFVVLSACNTAASDGRPGGEGLSGLARAFFYAGARSVLVSHWAVSDAATTTLVTSAFADLDAGGMRPAARARALQAGVREVRRDPRWSHPAYWAPFSLVGDPG